MTLRFRDSRPRSLLDFELTGTRLRLIPTAREHAAEIFHEFTPWITRYMYPKPADRIEETLEFIDSSRERMASGSNIQLTIEKKGDAEFLGCCGLHGQGKARKPELGVWLKSGAHGHGYGREAIALLVKWAFENLDIECVIYPADRRNSASRKIPESMGGILMGEKRDVGFGGNPLDLVIYRLDSPELRGRYPTR